MQVMIFSGDRSAVQDEFNKWAKGKALTKDVLIQSDADGAYVFIFVYYPEDKWRKAVQEAIPKAKESKEK